MATKWLRCARALLAALPLLALACVTPSTAQEGAADAMAAPAPLEGTYALRGTSSAGAVYTGTLVLRREDDGQLSATWSLGPGAAPRPVGQARLDDGALLVSWDARLSDGSRSLAMLRYAPVATAAPGQAWEFPGEQLTRLTRLVILHTNDHHGQVIPFLDPPTGRTVGGLAALATLVHRQREEAERIGAAVLLLDAGDLNTGVPESDLLDAVPDIAVMNALGYDAMAVGNHEFDVGLPALLRQRDQMHFPLLSANVLREDDGHPAFMATQVLERGGLRIGIVGLTTESAAFLTLPENRAGLRFEPALEVAKRVVPRLRAQCDLVLALTHLGYYPGGNYGTSTPGEVSLARAVPGLDAIVGGHTHTALPAPVVENGVPIVQAQDRARYLGRLDLLLDPQRKVVAHEGQLLPVIVKDPHTPANEVPEDPAVLALLAPHLAKVSGQLDEVVGRAPVLFDGERAHVRSGDTNLAFLVTDAYRAAGQTELAFAVGGGLRASLPAGDVTFRQVLTALPFDNRLVRGKLTGAQVLEVLRLGARQVAPSGGWLHVSGLTWTMDAGEPQDVLVAGAPLDPARLYTVTCDRFLADGGERYATLKAMQDRDPLPIVDADALRKFLQRGELPDYSTERRCTVASGPPAGGR